MGATVRVQVTVNGERRESVVEARTLLVHWLRDELGLTGTHIGCDTTNCGACTVHLDGESVKSCTVLAVQADGAEVTTIEGLAPESGLHPLQDAFWEKHGLQCGFCTPGMIMAAADLLERNPEPERRGDPPRPGGQPLPLHRLPQHRRSREGRRRRARCRHERHRPGAQAQGGPPHDHRAGALHRGHPGPGHAPRRDRALARGARRDHLHRHVRRQGARGRRRRAHGRGDGGRLPRRRWRWSGRRPAWR